MEVVAAKFSWLKSRVIAWVSTNKEAVLIGSSFFAFFLSASFFFKFIKTPKKQKPSLDQVIKPIPIAKVNGQRKQAPSILKRVQPKQSMMHNDTKVIYFDRNDNMYTADEIHNLEQE